MVKPLLLPLAFVLLLPAAAFAQNSFAGGGAVEATYKWSLPRAWSVRLGPGIELRPLYAGDDDDAAAPPLLRNVDLNASVERRWLEHWRFGSAVRARGRSITSDAERARELRTWLYAESITDVRYTRWSQRLRTEQRFRGDFGDPLALTYRHRYRVGLERALAGQTVDPEEWFFTVSAEVLLSTERFAARPTSIDLRPSITLGIGQYEFGLEYRSERGLNEDSPTTSRALLALLQISL